MGRKSKGDIVEELEKKIKELEQQNRRLKREINRLTPLQAEVTDLRDQIVKKPTSFNKVKVCQNCGKGQLIVLNVPNVGEINLCKVCNHREVIR